MLRFPVPKFLSVLYWGESLDELINFITRKDESVTMATLVERIFAYLIIIDLIDIFINLYGVLFRRIKKGSSSHGNI